MGYLSLIADLLHRVSAIAIYSHLFSDQRFLLALTMSKLREKADESLPNWARQVVHSFVSLAHLQPGMSVLCVGTSGIGQLVINVKNERDDNHGRIVGVESATEKLV